MEIKSSIWPTFSVRIFVQNVLDKLIFIAANGRQNTQRVQQSFLLLLMFVSKRNTII
jgi:hypothetical protein